MENGKESGPSEANESKKRDQQLHRFAPTFAFRWPPSPPSSSSMPSPLYAYAIACATLPAFRITLFMSYPLSAQPRYVKYTVMRLSCYVEWRCGKSDRWVERALRIIGRKRLSHSPSLSPLPPLSFSLFRASERTHGSNYFQPPRRSRSRLFTAVGTRDVSSRLNWNSV